MVTKKRFTLLELLVAMAVFSVMMTVLMQFFSSAQKVTLRTKTKTEHYEDARLIMEMITRDLKTCKYTVSGSGTSTSFTGSDLEFYARSAYATTPGEKVQVSYTLGGTTLTYTCGTQSDVLSNKVQSFLVEKDGGNSHMPNNVTITIKVGESSEDSNTFVKSIYIGGRGQ